MTRLPLLLTLLALPLPYATMACCYGKAEPVAERLHSVRAVAEMCQTRCEVMEHQLCPSFSVDGCYTDCDYRVVLSYDRCGDALWDLYLCQSLQDYTCDPSGVVILKDYPDECLQQAQALIHCYETPSGR